MSKENVPDYGNLKANELEFPTFVAPDMMDNYSRMNFTPIIGGFFDQGTNYIFGYLAVPTLHNLCATGLIMSCFIGMYGSQIDKSKNLPPVEAMGAYPKKGRDSHTTMARRSLARSMVTTMERWAKPSFLAFDRTQLGATRPTMELACTMDHGGLLGEFDKVRNALHWHRYTIYGAPKMLECGSFKNYSDAYQVGPAVLHRTRREETINGFAGWPAKVAVPKAVTDAYTPDVVRSMFRMFGYRGYAPTANLRD